MAVAHLPPHNPQLLLQLPRMLLAVGQLRLPCLQAALQHKSVAPQLLQLLLVLLASGRGEEEGGAREKEGGRGNQADKVVGWKA